MFNVIILETTYLRAKDFLRPSIVIEIEFLEKLKIAKFKTENCN